MNLKSKELCLTLLKNKEKDLLFLINGRRTDKRLNVWESELQDVRYAMEELK